MVGAAVHPAAARFARHSPGDRWFFDETHVKINGVWRYVLGALDLTVSQKILGILVGTETIALLVYAIALIASPHFEWSFQPLALSNLVGLSAGVVLALGFACYAGLEASAAYAEEARNVRRATVGMLITDRRPRPALSHHRLILSVSSSAGCR